jgi:hypothetical protein
MMNVEKLHESLQGESHTSKQRSELVGYLKDTIETLPAIESDRCNFAYQVAGFLSTNFAMSLDDGDKLDLVLTMAGELEIPADFKENKWREFCNLIYEL